MSGEAGRLHNRNNALVVVESIQKIINRTNPRTRPWWMTIELERASHKAQCVLGEFERIRKGFGDTDD